MRCEYIDHMGNDLTVVNAARVSFDKESYYEYHENLSTEEFSYSLIDKDKKLIKYLATHNHWTPFSHCVITLREIVPIFVARQRFKHFIGFNYWEVEDQDGLGFTYNETSRRYVDDAPEFYYPTGWRKRADNKKQGSSDELVETNEALKIEYELLLKKIEEYYRDMIMDGVAPEQARMVLPQSMYTSYYVTGSLPAFARAYNLRIDPHAQQEIRELAMMWDYHIHQLFPISWEALTTKKEII